MSAANGVNVYDILEIANVGQDEVLLVRGRGPDRFVERNASLSLLPARNKSFARFCTQPVTSVSAGPPLGGLYLKPPSSGGLWDGVMTMPSAEVVFAAAVVDENRA